MANGVSDAPDYPLPQLGCLHIFMKIGEGDILAKLAFIRVIVRLYTDGLRISFFLGIPCLSKGDLKWFKGDLI